MKNFKSKELNRTFPEVVFVDNISTEPITEKKSDELAGDSASLSKRAGKPILVKKEVKVEPAKDGITIGELYREQIVILRKDSKSKRNCNKVQ